MKTTYRMILATLITPLVLTGCLDAMTQQNTVMVSELTAICGAIVGGQAEQRINEEWSKYPSADASRATIETVAGILLTNPDGTSNTLQYKQYLTCATGMLLTQ